MEKLLVVEGSESDRGQLKAGLGEEYTILEGSDRPQAMELFLKHVPRVVTLDLGLSPTLPGGLEGLRFLEWMIESRPGTKIVVMTGNEGRELAYRAVRCGAYDFYQKPIDVTELKIVIRRAFHLSSIEEQKRRLQKALERSSAGIEGIAGQCAAIRQLYAALQKVAPLEPGLVQEEIGGTGGQAGREPLHGGTRFGEEGADQHAEGQGGVFSLATEHLTLREVRDRVEKAMITAAVGNCGGNMVRASELLGVSRPALYDLLKKHGLFKHHGARH